MLGRGPATVRDEKYFSGYAAILCQFSSIFMLPIFRKLWRSEEHNDQKRITVWRSEEWFAKFAEISVNDFLKFLRNRTKLFIFQLIISLVSLIASRDLKVRDDERGQRGPLREVRAEDHDADVDGDNRAPGPHGASANLIDTAKYGKFCRA